MPGIEIFDEMHQTRTVGSDTRAAVGLITGLDTVLLTERYKPLKIGPCGIQNLPVVIARVKFPEPDFDAGDVRFRTCCIEFFGVRTFRIGQGYLCRGQRTDEIL